MVIAESFELDTGTVVLIIVMALGMLLGAAIATGLVGMMIGVAIARRSQHPEQRATLASTGRVWVVTVGVAATLAAWILLLTIGSALVDDAWGLVLVWLGGFAVAITWGWWCARRYRFDGRATR